MIELPVQTIFHTIEKSIKEYRRFAQRNLKKTNTDITVDQALLLTYLNNHSDFSQNKIAVLMFKDNASVTRMIELLIKKKYLKRHINEQDRRKFNLKLTAVGQKTLNDFFPVISSNRNIALKGITNNEIDQLNNILTKIINNCNPK